MADKPNLPVVSENADLDNVPAYIPGSDWETLTQGADEAFGFDLAKDELLNDLVGVPFVVTRITFRPGVGATHGAMATLECVIAPAPVLARKRIDISAMPLGPSVPFVFNDGSTGVYRQIVSYLAGSGRIAVDESKPEEGDSGVSRYDSNPTQWRAINAGKFSCDPADPDGTFVYEVNVRFVCPRGLRISRYEYKGKEAFTRYLG